MVPQCERIPLGLESMVAKTVVLDSDAVDHALQGVSSSEEGVVDHQQEHIIVF